jgi:hypothetical protein
MADNPVWAICERVAEALDDHIECGKHSAADVVVKAQAVLSETELLGRCSMSATSRRTRRRPSSEPKRQWHLNFAAALAPLAGFSGIHRVLGGQPQTFPMLSQLTHFPSGPL